jgi:hypothetical protein
LSSILPAVFTGIVFVVALWRLPLLHPVQLWSGSWAVSTSLYALRLLPYRDLSWLTAGLICGGVVAFAAGVPLGERIAARRQVSRPARSDVATVQLAAWLSIALLTVTLAAFLSHLIARFGVVRTLRITTEVKVYLAGAEAPASGGYVQVAVAAAALCALAAALAGTAGLRRRWLVAAIACAGTAYFSTSRGFIGVALIAGLASLGVAAMNIDRRSLVKMTIALGAVMLVLFFGLGAVIGKTYGNSTIGGFDNFFSRHQAVSSLALPYEDLTASVPSLDLLVRDSTTWGRAHGCATAPIACGVVRKLGVPAVRVPVTAPFTSAPLQCPDARPRRDHRCARRLSVGARPRGLDRRHHHLRDRRSRARVRLPPESDRAGLPRIAAGRRPVARRQAALALALRTPHTNGALIARAQALARRPIQSRRHRK